MNFLYAKLIDSKPSYSKSQSNDALEANEISDQFSSFNSIDDTKNIQVSSQSIEQKLDEIVKDWLSGHDMLFCIHPLDGSILIWLAKLLHKF
jgi:hypothetical protein